VPSRYSPLKRKRLTGAWDVAALARGAPKGVYSVQASGVPVALVMSVTEPRPSWWYQ
jgi:hypothetical protein